MRLSPTCLLQIKTRESRIIVKKVVLIFFSSNVQNYFIATCFNILALINDQISYMHLSLICILRDVMIDSLHLGLMEAFLWELEAAADMTIKRTFFMDFFCVFISRALMDCLVLPIQNKLEEWRKASNTLDKEHAKGT